MIAATRKTRAVLLITALLAVPALAGAYRVWELLAMGTRPWHLEARVEALLAECRTTPGILSFRAEYARLAARVEQAKLALLAADRRWWPRRSYEDSVPRLLSACLDAQLLKLRLAQRQQEQRVLLTALLASLRLGLDSNSQGGRIWSRFEFRNLEQSRTRSLLEQAERLASVGAIESAIDQARQAWSAWRRFHLQSDLEFVRFEDAGLREKWDQQAMELLRWTSEAGRRAILVDKLEHRCLLLHRGQIERSYPADLGRNWYRQKAQEDDASTPEGEYRVRRMIPAGRYGPALLLDYPNRADVERFRGLKQNGLIPPGARIGGNVEIHGGGRSSDWTDGCVSLDGDEMSDLYRRSYVGMPVTIVGTCRLAASVQDR